MISNFYTFLRSLTAIFGDICISVWFFPVFCVITRLAMSFINFIPSLFAHLLLLSWVADQYKYVKRLPSRPKTVRSCPNIINKENAVVSGFARNKSVYFKRWWQSIILYFWHAVRQNADTYRSSSNLDSMYGYQLLPQMYGTEIKMNW